MLRNFRDIFRKVTIKKDGGLTEVLSYIDGSWQAGEGERLEIYGPATGVPYGTLVDCSLDQIQTACQEAKLAQKYWHFEVGEQEKQAIFRKFIDLLKAYRTQLVSIRVKESGRIVEMCDADVQELIDTFEHYHGEIPKAGGGVFERCQMSDKYGITSRSPYGRGVVIYPWNFMAIWGWGVAAELAGGNAAIVKVTSETPFAAACLTELLYQAIEEVLGIERWLELKALVQLIQGRGSVTGDNLVRYGEYEHLTFTGGKDIGSQIAGIAGSRLKKVTMELGGHNAIIVMPDFPMEKAVAEVLAANLGDAGERCVSARAVFVEESIFDKFVQEYVQAALALRIGHPADLETQLNPLISQWQLESVQGFVDRAVDAGIHPLIGGFALATGEDLEAAKAEGFNADLGLIFGGYYYLPTVFTDVPMDAELMIEECFGPVLCINRFSGQDGIGALDNAIELVNQSQYGLSNALLTCNQGLAMRALERIETGLLYIGRGTTGAELGKYFGGAKNSGWGRKGKGIEDSTYIKQVYIDYHPTARMAQVGSEEQLEERYADMEDFFV